MSRARTGSRDPMCWYRHWFAYTGQVGTSSPVCVRCGEPNPNYDPTRDTQPARRSRPSTDTTTNTHRQETDR